MRRSVAILSLVALIAVLASGCESRTDKTDGGGVLLSVSDFDGLPVQVSVNAAVAVGLVSIGEVTVENVPKNPTGTTSDLMNVEINSYEVTFSRGDQGTRVPTPLVRGLFGVAPVGGTFTVENLPILSLEQLSHPSLEDLASQGKDPETGGESILLNLRLRFFGRTLSGDAVESAPANFTIEFLP